MLAGIVLLAAVTTAEMPPGLFEDFSTGRYQQMIQQVDSVLASPVGLTLPELALLHVWKGFGLAAAGERQAARASFSVALSLDSGIELDPREVSPKILAEFEAARVSPATGAEVVPAVYLVMEDLRPRAALQSMVVPGWGQWTMGRKIRGALIGAAACAAAGGWLATAKWEDDAHDRYLASTGQGIAPAYDEYNRAFKIRRALSYTTLAVWAGAVADVLLGPSTAVHIVASGADLGLGASLR